MKYLKASRALRCSQPTPFILVVFLIGCSGAPNYDVAKLTDGQRATLRQLLTADQLKDLNDWIARNSVDGKIIPQTVTVQQALTDQEKWLAKKKADEVAADEQRNKAQAERVGKQKELAKVLSVSLVSKKNKIRADEQSVVILEISYADNSDKDIQSVTGVLKLIDIYGYDISEISCSYNGGVTSKRVAIEYYPDIVINKTVEAQVKLWNTDFEKLKSLFEVNTIIFKDGTSMNAT